MRIKTGITVWLAVVIVIVAVVAFAMSYFVSDYFKQTILKRDVDVNSKFIALQARQHLTANDFVPANYEARDKTFSQFFHEIGTDEVVRIKVWSPDQIVLYSDDKSIEGQIFHDDDELNEALDGSVVSDISDLSKTENTFEKSYGQLMEIYIPIKSDSGKVIGVIETYTSMDLVNSYIDEANNIIMLITSVGIGIIGAVILLAFTTFRKNVINPILEIRNQAKEIKDGNLDIKSNPVGYDELKTLGTEVEVMASKLKEQQARTAKAERLSAIGELAARLAHDLRNPLSVIRNSLLLIRHKYSSMPDSAKDFARIDRSVSRMSHQLENVMDFVTIRDIQLEPSSLNEVIKNAVEKANIPDSVKVSMPAEDITIVCDPSKLEVVFDNILVNAKQAMGDSGTVDIRTGKEGKLVKIEVRDSGPGIPEDVLPNIFEPLFTTKQEGTGLGLPSCKNIVEQHGGSISVETQLGRGTKFTISLPMTAAQNLVVPAL